MVRSLDTDLGVSDSGVYITSITPHLPESLNLFICGTAGKEILTLPQGKLMTDLYFLITTLLRYNSHTIKFSPLKCIIWWFLRSSQSCTTIAVI